jgi:hypothetical protein
MQGKGTGLSKALLAVILALVSFSLFANLLIIVQTLLEPVKVIKKTDGRGGVGEGDAVIARSDEEERISPGDLVIFCEPGVEGMYSAYRVEGFLKDERGVDCALVKDAAGTRTIPLRDAVGKAWLVLPGGGSFLEFLRTPRGFLLCVVSPWILLVIYLTLNSLRAQRLQGSRA